MPLKRKKKRGLNIQQLCRIKFGSGLGNLKVCRLRKVASEQKWHSLSESQQRKMYGLTDDMKQALGLSGTVKGWKALSHDDARDVISKKSKLQRWNIPGEVLKDLVR